MHLLITLGNDVLAEEVMSLTSHKFVRIKFDEDPLPPISHSWDGEKFSHSIKGVNLKDVSVVWFRVPPISYNLDFLKKPYWLLNRKAREEAIIYLYDILEDARWISNPRSIKRAENKMLQLIEARKLGFSIPITLVTNNSSEVGEFRSKYGEILVKPITPEMVEVGKKIKVNFTSRIPSDKEVDFSLLASSPAIFQVEVQRIFDIRVAVLGENVFAASIEQVEEKAGDVDWRKGRSASNLVLKPHSLPESVKERCVALVKTLNIETGAIDLILSKDLQYYFLEINPTGAWGFIEDSTGLPLRKAMAEML